MQIQVKNFIISDEKSKLQIEKIHELLSTTYWANNRSYDTIAKSIQNSLCFGVYLDKIQIGFARCVTDYATFYWLADVVIDEKYRGKGLGKALIKAVIEHKQLEKCNGVLITNDAHGLYEQYGFSVLDGKFMKKPNNE